MPINRIRSHKRRADRGADLQRADGDARAVRVIVARARKYRRSCTVVLQTQCDHAAAVRERARNCGRHSVCWGRNHSSGAADSIAHIVGEQIAVHIHKQQRTIAARAHCAAAD